MIPQFFIELKDTTSSKEVFKPYFDNQYPDSTDCKVLETQMKQIQTDVNEIQFRKDSAYREFNGSFNVKVPCELGASSYVSGCVGGFKSVLNPDHILGNQIRQRSQDYLATLYYIKKDKLAKCVTSSASTSSSNIGTPKAQITDNQRSFLDTLLGKETPSDVVLIDPVTGVKTTVPGVPKKKNNLLIYIFVGSSILLTGVGIWYYKKQK